MVAWPRNGSTIWIATATRMKTTLAGVPGSKPALSDRTSAAPTMRMSPSVSKPIWVSQLKSAMTREPFGP